LTTDLAPHSLAVPLAHGFEDGAKRLLKRAVAALARREYSSAEIERKLRRELAAEDDPADVRRVIERLQVHKLLSDTRMAQALVRARSARYGRRRLQQELERRGVDRDTIAAVLPPPADEAAVALALWRGKFGCLPATQNERARQGRFLAARGFSSAVIVAILRGSEDAIE